MEPVAQSLLDAIDALRQRLLEVTDGGSHRLQLVEDLLHLRIHGFADLLAETGVVIVVDFVGFQDCRL